jgi:hypothetical protein
MKNIGVYSVLVIFMAAGCVSRKAANAKAQAAFLAGRQAALAQQAQGPVVQVVGDVKTHVIPWTEDLTLINALIAAEYQGVGDPSQITVVRDGQPTVVSPRQLLRGEDMALQAGDRIEIRP